MDPLFQIWKNIREIVKALLVQLKIDKLVNFVEKLILAQFELDKVPVDSQKVVLMKFVNKNMEQTK